MSALLFPSSVGPGGGYGGGYGSGGGDDPDRRGGHGHGGHGADDNYEPIDAEGESDGSSHRGEEEESREEQKTPKGAGKKKEKKKPDYNSAKRRKHYKDNNVTAANAAKTAMVDSLNRFRIPNRMGGAPGSYVLADAERSHFCQSKRPEPERVNDFEFYWRQNPSTNFDAKDQNVWDHTFGKSGTASRWGAQNLNHLVSMLESNKIVPSRSFKRNNRPAQAPAQPPQNRSQPSASVPVPGMNPNQFQQSQVAMPTTQAQEAPAQLARTNNPNLQQNTDSPFGEFVPFDHPSRQQGHAAAAQGHIPPMAQSHVPNLAHRPPPQYTQQAQGQQYYQPGGHQYYQEQHGGVPNPQGQNQQGQGRGQNPHGQNPHGQNPHGQNPHGQNQHHGQQPPGQNRRGRGGPSNGSKYPQ
ncbi:hypothetical protein AOL_s00193g182 [Orbilia oligospora ATCC 24927]|uniref:Uncharacterized protein n=1 Tax=Arthrobotrys oligospora (strain ATCC 24927 / CBS 115.81 / DSM 1491) TaxID=756982 RepID=G1XRI3_ARTOA|nr:hypothetical protein AOL_s00193g182 [Orbilia oligospora ATCC 24927]EGX44270.1 hypothetical protein AOL_s00193g182 [Orbilia oligospora ATCC 24927]